MRELTEAEKREVIDCIELGRSLPDKYRFLLFANRRSYELVWEGKTGSEQAPEPLFGLMQRFRFHFHPQASGFSGQVGPHCRREAGIWTDKLIRGDNRHILAALLQGPVREEIEAQGGIKLIYIDPPFCTEAEFSIASDSGRRNPDSIAYSDKWANPAAFLNMLHERLRLMHNVLACDGSIYVHCDWRMNSCLRLMLDEVFGNYVNEICWHYTGGGRSGKYFSRKHDSIFIYSKSAHFIFNKDAIRIPYKPTSSYAKSGIKARSGKRYLPNPAGAVPDDVWDIPIINPLSGERLGYPTQKPETLIERIIRASSNPGDLVADFFCGSGTFPAVAARLGRKWLAADSGRLAIHTARKRLLAAKPETAGLNWRGFEIWSLERQGGGLDGSACDAGAEGVHIEARPCVQGRNVAIQLLGFGSKGSVHENHAGRPWTDWLDYWAVDYEYGLEGISDGGQGEFIFNSCWQTWKRGANCGLELISPCRELPPGLHRIAVEAADIFGNSGIVVFSVNLPE